MRKVKLQMHVSIDGMVASRAEGGRGYFNWYAELRQYSISNAANVDCILLGRKTVLLMAFGLAVLVGVILLMMLVTTGIEHSPDQSSMGQGATAIFALARIGSYPQRDGVSGGEPPATGSPPNELADRTQLAGQSGLGPLLIAELVEKEANAKSHRQSLRCKRMV